LEYATIYTQDSNLVLTELTTVRKLLLFISVKTRSESLKRILKKQVVGMWIGLLSFRIGAWGVFSEHGN
jgi:hypothetical protein